MAIITVTDININYAQFNLHCFYVGILSGMRPCGVIVILTELFIAESKSQVYG